MIKPDTGHDWYCFRCHLGAGVGPIVGCKDCPRIFHLECLLDDRKPDGDLCICPPCHIMATKPSAQLLNLEPKQLNKLLEHSCHFLEDWGTPQLNRADGETWAIASNREAKDTWRYDLLVYFNIDLSQMLEKAVGGKYKSLEEFQVDCETLVHGISVYFGVKQPKGQDIAAFFHKDVTYIIQEIKSCHECVLRYYEKEDIGPLWFCLPCKTPHKVVWAKLSSHPYWPAKVMKIIDGSKYHVIFFGGNHEWGVIDVKNIQPIETPLSSLKIRETADWNEAYAELEQFLEIAKNPKKVYSLLTTKARKLVTPVKSKGAAGKRAASSTVQNAETKKSKNERTARKSQEDIERAEPNLDIKSHSYKLRRKDPPVFSDNDDDASTNSFPGRKQQPSVFVNIELMKVKMEVDYVPVLSVKKEPPQNVNQEIEDDNNDNEEGQINSNSPSFSVESRDNYTCTAQSDDDDMKEFQLLDSERGQQEPNENNVLNIQQEIQKEKSEHERVAKLEEEIKKNTQIQMTLENKIDQLNLLNEHRKTTINTLDTVISQQWFQVSRLKAQVQLQQNQIEELNGELKSSGGNGPTAKIQDLNLTSSIKRHENQQLKSQVTKQRKQIEVLNNKLQLAEENQQSFKLPNSNTANSTAAVQIRKLPLKVLSHIFDHLDLQSLKSSRFVCRRWMNECGKILLKNFHLVCDDKKRCENALINWLRNSYSTSKTMATAQKLWSKDENAQETLQLLRKFKRLRNSITELVFSPVQPKTETLYEILNQLPNLQVLETKTLDLSPHQNWLMTGTGNDNGIPNKLQLLVQKLQTLKKLKLDFSLSEEASLHFLHHRQQFASIKSMEILHVEGRNFMRNFLENSPSLCNQNWRITRFTLDMSSACTVRVIRSFLIQISTSLQHLEFKLQNPSSIYWLSSSMSCLEPWTDDWIIPLGLNRVETLRIERAVGKDKETFVVKCVVAALRLPRLKKLSIDEIPCGLQLNQIIHKWNSHESANGRKLKSQSLEELELLIPFGTSPPPLNSMMIYGLKSVKCTWKNPESFDAKN